MCAAAASSRSGGGAGLVGRLFSKRNLFFTNVALSFSLSGLGDWLQQVNENKKSATAAAATSSSKRWNARRTLHMSVSFGLTSGFLCHYWYNFLDRAVVGRGFAVIGRKIVYDQLLFSPVCLAACLIVAGAYEGSSRRQIASDVVHKGGNLYLAECLVWPPAQFVNFYFLPTRFRVVFDNLVSLGFDTYTSYVKHTPSNREVALFGAFFGDDVGDDCSAEDDYSSVIGVEQESTAP